MKVAVSWRSASVPMAEIERGQPRRQEEHHRDRERHHQQRQRRHRAVDPPQLGALLRLAVVHERRNQRAADRAADQQIAHLLDGAQGDDERAAGRAIEEDVDDLDAHHAQQTAEQLAHHDDARRAHDAPPLRAALAALIRPRRLDGDRLNPLAGQRLIAQNEGLAHRAHGAALEGNLFAGGQPLGRHGWALERTLIAGGRRLWLHGWVLHHWLGMAGARRGVAADDTLDQLGGAVAGQIGQQRQPAAIRRHRGRLRQPRGQARQRSERRIARLLARHQTAQVVWPDEVFARRE